MPGIRSLVGRIGDFDSGLRNTDGRLKDINETFRRTAQVTKEQAEEMEHLADAFIRSEENIKSYERTIDAIDQQLASGLSAAEAKAKQDLKAEFKRSIDTETKRLNRLGSEIQGRNQGKASTQDVIAARRQQREETDKTKRGSNISQFVNKVKASPVAFAIDTAISIIEGGIQQLTAYMQTHYQNTLKMLQANTVENVNAMKSNLASWNDSLAGAFEAQSGIIASTQATIEAQNAMDLANLKLQHTWTNWIPIIGQKNKLDEETMAMEQQVYEQRLKQAAEYIAQGRSYAEQAAKNLNKQDEAIRKLGTSVMMSSSQMAGFEKHMFDLGPSLAVMNRNITDLLKLQEEIQEQSGRTFNLSDNEATTSLAVGRVVGDQNLAQFASEMTLFNKSILTSANIMNNMAKSVSNMGLSHSKVTKSILNNLKLAEKYQFKGGIQGFIETAKWAENVRLALSTLGSIIDKIQTGGLEGVITQSAQLQVLGGNFAMNANPLAMAYNAFADPKALGEQLAESIRGMGVFNRETGETEFGIADKMRINATAKAYGMQPEEIMDMVREQDKKRVVAEQMRGTGLSNETMASVANKAQMNEQGQYYVNIIDEQGKAVSKLVSEIRQTDIEHILTGNTEEDTLEYAKTTMGFAERIAAATEEVSAIMSAATLKDYAETVKNDTEQMTTAFANNIQQVANTISEAWSAASDAQTQMLNKLSNLDKTFQKALTEMNKANEEAAALATAMAEALQLRLEQDKEIKGKEDVATQKVKEYDEDKNYFTRMGKMWKMFQAQGDVTASRAQAAYANGNNNLGDMYKIQEWAWDRTLAPILHNIGDIVGLGYLDSKTRNNAQNPPKADDAIAQGSGSPMIIGASQVTPVSDGTAQFARTDPKDTAVFAKTGGPFDKLFDGVFRKIDAVYTAVANMSGGKTFNNIFNPSTIGNIRNTANNTTVSDVVRNFATSTASNVRNAVSNAVSTSDEIRNVSNTLYSPISKNDGMKMSIYDLLRLHAMENNNIARIYPDDRNPFTNDMPMDYGLSDNGAPRTAPGTQPNVRIDPININLSGNLTLSGGGTSVDIGKELANNPLLVREIAKLLSESLSAKLYGGKSAYNGGQNTYFR
ncbi:MAG: hypothetical protein LUD72_04430 [Bacteroidales bacterium]|nr:hypothetical protein [Bacteroidales bacterium]